MTKRIRIIKPDKDAYLKTIDNIDTESCWEKIGWLAYSDLDIIFYRVDGNRVIELTKEEMKIALLENWEMRG
jgi:hypothetical protein